MLHIETVEQGTITLLRNLQALPELREMYLVGGTALALYYGHRKSIDLDLFGVNFNKALGLDSIKENFQNIEFIESPASWGLFCYINNVKVDIVNYEHAMLEKPLIIDGLRLYNPVDIGAMKINAILRRGSKKDFWDIRELLNHFSLDKLITSFEKKFPDQRQLISVPQALVYFDDAESSPDPICLKNLKWEVIKRDIQKAVSLYLS
jgi:hypothetical protein